MKKTMKITLYAIKDNKERVYEVNYNNNDYIVGENEIDDYVSFCHFYNNYSITEYKNILKRIKELHDFGYTSVNLEVII